LQATYQHAFRAITKKARAKTPWRGALPLTGQTARTLLRSHEESERVTADEEPLLDIARALERLNYHFVSVTPETRRRVLARRGGGEALSQDLRDVFGWNLPFDATLLPPGLLDTMLRAEIVDTSAGMMRSSVGFSTCMGRLFVRSAAPTTAKDAVFFGPDTYRFCAFLKQMNAAHGHLVDIGCGSGAGGLVLAENVTTVTLTDINERALAYARINALLAGCEVNLVESNVLESVHGRIDTIVANPPYLQDSLGRQYRHGGGSHGEALGLRIVEQAVESLRPNGVLLLYTGAPIIAGRDSFWEQAKPILARRHARTHYSEIDPDIFGEELELPANEGVERFAAVGLCARMPGSSWP